MKKVKTVDAVGMELCHDITKIVKDDFKGIAFKKGHIIREEDVKELLSLGKDHIYIWEDEGEFLHEVEGAVELKKICMGDGLEATEVKEGKIEFISLYDGLFKVDLDKLLALNMIDDLILSVIKEGSIVKKGDKVGATKVIPLLVSKEKILEAQKILTEPIIRVKKFATKKTAIVTTGNEVYYGRIKDGFGQVLREKMSEYDCEVMGQSILPDNQNKITEEILSYIDKGAELILCTGGMSVDPDDVTPSAIKNCGSEIISYGTPVLPGAMFLMAYYKDIPIMGLPGSVMFSKKTVFDIILPKVLAGEKITKQKIASLANGGFLV